MDLSSNLLAFIGKHGAQANTLRKTIKAKFANKRKSNHQVLPNFCSSQTPHEQSLLNS